MQEEMLQERWQKLADWHEILLSEDTHHLGADYKGWVKLPEEMVEDLIIDLVETAREIQDKCTLFIVVGNGGSLMNRFACVSSANPAEQ